MNHSIICQHFFTSSDLKKFGMASSKTNESLILTDHVSAAQKISLNTQKILMLYSDKTGKIMLHHYVRISWKSIKRKEIEICQVNPIIKRIHTYISIILSIVSPKVLIPYTHDYFVPLLPFIHIFIIERPCIVQII